MKKLPSTSKLLAWLDRNLLLYLAGFLLVFIPLFPKIPLLDVIPGYIVRVRTEDFLILIAAIVWLVQALRRKVRVNSLITQGMVLYAVIGFLSCLSAIFITKTVPLSAIHIEKLFLNYFRRLEYFSLFFVFFSAIQSLKQVKTMLITLVVVVIGIAGYGFGQKYLYWPVYSTMNREFSKGIKLYLTDHARVPSTFAGHYDAAAYIMMALSFILAVLFFAKNKWLKLMALISFVMGFWLLILTASRTSFIAYLAAVTVFMFLLALVKGFKWSIPRYLLIMLFSMVIMLSFGDLSARFAQVLGLDRLKDQYDHILFGQKAQKPADFESTNANALAQVTTPSDQPPKTTNPNDTSSLPPDVYEKIPIPVPELDENGKPTGNYINVSRTYSDNAYKYGLSAAIRFDTLWPRALAGFDKNPLLGSGYSTLTKESVGQFTEAESTDNDYLRNLGESGLLGALSFYGMIVAAAVVALKTFRRVVDPLLKAFLLAFVAGTIGLLLNAVYIDIFESSKVAETFWALTGMVFAISVLVPAGKKKVAPVKNYSTK